MSWKEKIKPRLTYSDVSLHLSDRIGDREIRSGTLYRRLRELISPLEPVSYGEYDKRWFGLYLPVRRDGKAIAIPMTVMRYRRKFMVNLEKVGWFSVSAGGQGAERFYATVIAEAKRFLSLIRRLGTGIIRELVPYDHRVGVIEGKYVMEMVMPKSERARILKMYREHESRNLRQKGGCSLNEYLRVARICYVAAFGRKAARLGPRDAYMRWADGRHGNMLNIKDPDSRREFAGWRRSGKWVGSHPFEIVFSWGKQGISLYPPERENGWMYELYAGNFAYADLYVRMVKALVRRRIPFRAPDLRRVLDYMSGDVMFSVNEPEEFTFEYIPCKEYKEKYFQHIVWKEPKLPRWKATYPVEEQKATKINENDLG